MRQLLSKAESKAAAGGLPGRRHHVLTGVALPCTGLTRALDHCREFGLAYPSAAGGVQYSDAKVANRDARVSTARQRMALERWTNPKPYGVRVASGTGYHRGAPLPDHQTTEPRSQTI